MHNCHETLIVEQMIQQTSLTKLNLPPAKGRGGKGGGGGAQQKPKLEKDSRISLSLPPPNGTLSFKREANKGNLATV